MASPRTRASPPPAAAAAASPPGSSGGDEAIWRKLRAAGFDEDSVKRRDKSALIGYITRLETEIYDYQHNLGLVLLERKEWTSKYEQLKASSESAEIMYKREKAAQQSAIAEARKREESLKRNLGIQKECVANLEKALHDMRGETAEIKVSYETKLAEALQMIGSAQKKFDEAEEKLLAAKSLEAESIRTRSVALRSLRDIEDREDQLRRCRISSELEKESKEKDISLQRRSVNETKKILHEKEQGLLKEQALLSQRDENILARLAYLTHLEKRLEEEKLTLEAERKALVEEKNNLELKVAAIVSREEAIIQKESLLDKRESELLVFQETIASKERAEIQRLNQEQQTVMGRRRCEFEAEMENKRMAFEAEMEVRNASMDQKEAALGERERSVVEREHTVDIELAGLAVKQEGIAKRTKELEEEEENFLSHREAQQIELQREREEIQKRKLDLEKEKAFFEDKKQEAIQVQESLVITKAERNELLMLQTKLKEEIDNLRAQKLELMADADKLQAEKERFEIEWELIDEKKEELQKEAARIAEERRAITEHLKNELDSIKREKDSLRIQFKNNSESLSREHEEFMSKMQHEHASWLGKMQQEREDLQRDVDVQRTELLNSVKARQQEIDFYLREKEEAFEQKKAKELEYINSQKKIINSQLEHVASELQKLENERKEAALQREQREQELLEAKRTIEALNIQREKLQEQRKLLHSDREVITEQIKHLNELEELKIDSENKQLSIRQSERSRLRSKTKVRDNGLVRAPIDDQNASPKNCSSPKLLLEKIVRVSPSVSTPVAFVRKCAEVIFRRSPDKGADHDNDRDVQNRVSGKVEKAVEANAMRSTLGSSREKSNSLVTANIGTSLDAVSTQLGERTGEVPRADNGMTVGKKRLNRMVSNDQSDILEPRRKQQRKSTAKKADRGTVTYNSPSAMDEKCSKREHDAAPLGLSASCKNKECGKPSEDLLCCKNGKSGNQDDVPDPGSFMNHKGGSQNQLMGKFLFDDGEHSEDITASVTEQSNGGLKDRHEPDEDSDDEVEDEEKSVKEKLWHFLIT